MVYKGAGSMIKFNKKKGFTLVETLVAIVIIGIMSIVFVNVITGGVARQHKTKRVTVGAYKLQKEIEEKMHEYRTGDSSLFKVKSSAFGVAGLDVRMRDVVVEGDYHEFSSAVSTFRLPEYILPEVKEVKLQGKKGSANVRFLLPIDDYSAKGSFLMDNSTLDNFLTNDLNFYISKPGFNAPYSDDLEESDLGVRVPLFPQDYELVPRSDRNSMNFPNNLVKNYPGRHIVFSVTPGAKNGEIGKGMHSRPVFIHGLTIREDLILHLDGSIYDPSKVTSGELISWLDLSKNRADSIPNMGDKPKLLGKDNTAYFVGDRVEFEEGDQMLSKITPAQLAGRTKFTVYAVAKPSNPSDGIDSFIKAGTRPSPDKIPPTDIITSADFKIYKTININPNTGGLDVFIGDEDVEIAEIIIYKKEIKDGSDKDKEIKKYFKDKYKAVDTIGIKIDRFLDINLTLYQNQSFEMPVRAKALLDSGYTRTFEVEWDEELDTSKLGVTVIEGHKKDDDDKKIKLTATIVPYIQLNHIEFEKPLYEVAPDKNKQLKLKYTPENATNKKAAFSSDNPSIVSVDSKGRVTGIKIGSAVITAVVHTPGGEQKATCVVKVAPQPTIKDGLVLWLDASDEKSFVFHTHSTAPKHVGHVYYWKNKAREGEYDFQSDLPHDWGGLIGKRYSQGFASTPPEYIKAAGGRYASVRFHGKKDSLFTNAHSLGKFQTAQQGHQGSGTVFIVAKHNKIKSGTYTSLFSQSNLVKPGGDRSHSDRYITYAMWNHKLGVGGRKNLLSSSFRSYVAAKQASVNPTDAGLKNIHTFWNVVDFEEKENIKISTGWRRGRDAVSDIGLASKVSEIQFNDFAAHRFYLGEGRIGLALSNYQFIGDMYEVLVFDRPLDAYEREAILEYLNLKWGMYN